MKLKLKAYGAVEVAIEPRDNKSFDVHYHGMVVTVVADRSATLTYNDDDYEIQTNGHYVHLSKGYDVEALITIEEE